MKVDGSPVFAVPEMQQAGCGDNHSLPVYMKARHGT